MVLVVPPTLSVIVSIWMETLFYGMNVVLYFLCIYDLLFVRKYSSNTTKRLLVSLTTILFLTITAHIGVNCRRLILGYVNPPDKDAMTIFLLDITQPTNVAKQFLVVLTNLFSNMLIIWRIYMVWQKSWKACVFNVLLCASFFVSGIVTATYISRVRPGQNIFAHQISTWAKAQASFALATNVSATLLIAGRILWMTKSIREHHPHRMGPYWRIVIIVVESAAFDAVAQIIQLGFYASNFPGVYFVADTLVQINAMNPLLIIAFVGHTRNLQHGRHQTTTYLATSRILSEPVFAADAPNSTCIDSQLSGSGTDVGDQKAVRLSFTGNERSLEKAGDTNEQTFQMDKMSSMDAHVV